MKVLTGSQARFDGAERVWLRCAFHVHTTESDEWLTPVIQRKQHAWAGYDVLVITDHDRLTSEPPGDDDLILIGGPEFNLTAPKSCGPLHLPHIGITSQPVGGKGATRGIGWRPGDSRLASMQNRSVGRLNAMTRPCARRERLRNRWPSRAE
jgi:hypothetical protein